MLKDEAKAILDAKFEKVSDDQDWEEIFSSLYNKFDSVPDELFHECISFVDVRTVIQNYKVKSSRKAPTRKTYSKLEAPIDSATEKAIGIVTGSNNMNGSNYKEYTSWLPTSQVIEEDGKVYIPNWLVNSNNMWGFVNSNDRITR